MRHTDVIPGKVYEIRWRGPSQRYDRRSVLRFIGTSTMDESALVFDARPLAGTQVMLSEWILEILPAADGARKVMGERWSKRRIGFKTLGR